MYYFKFTIPKNKDGSTATYSPGWCGTRDKCALNEKGLLYNDKELWGIGQAEGDYIPDDVEVLDEKTALSIIAEAKDEDKVYFGEKLANRWNPEVVVEDKEQEPVLTENGEVDYARDTKKAVFCPICHKFIMWLPENIVAKTINLTCPVGHKVNLTSEVSNGV